METLFKSFVGAFIMLLFLNPVVGLKGGVGNSPDTFLIVTPVENDENSCTDLANNPFAIESEVILKQNRRAEAILEWKQSTTTYYAAKVIRGQSYAGGSSTNIPMNNRYSQLFGYRGARVHINT